MDEVIKRRLVGAAALIGLAFLVSLLLPKAGPRSDGNAATQVVTIPLDGSAVVEEQAPADAEVKPEAEVAASPLPAYQPRLREEVMSPEAALVETPPDELEIQSPGDDDAPPADVGSGMPEPEVAELPPPEIINAPEPQAVEPARAEPVAPKPAVTKPEAAAKPEIKPAVKPEAAPAKPVPAKPAPAKPQPAPAKPEVAKPPATAPASAAKPGERWFVQAGAYADIAKARQVEAQIRAMGQSVMLSPTETANNTTLYRVRSGPYTSREAADAARAKIAQAKITASLHKESR